MAKKPHAIAKIAEGSLFIIMILVAEECACGCCWQRARADVVAAAADCRRGIDVGVFVPIDIDLPQ